MADFFFSRQFACHGANDLTVHSYHTHRYTTVRMATHRIPAGAQSMTQSDEAMPTRGWPMLVALGSLVGALAAYPSWLTFFISAIMLRPIYMLIQRLWWPIVVQSEQWPSTSVTLWRKAVANTFSPSNARVTLSLDWGVTKQRCATMELLRGTVLALKEKNRCGQLSHKRTSGCIIITGATSGIGRAVFQRIVRLLQHMGSDVSVLLVGRSQQRMEAVISETLITLGEPHVSCQSHVLCLETSPANAYQQLAERFTALDGTASVDSANSLGYLIAVVHCAALCYSTPQPFTSLSLEQLAQITNANVTATSLLLRTLVPRMSTIAALGAKIFDMPQAGASSLRESTAPQLMPSLWVNVGSLSASGPNLAPFLSHYAASKAYGMTMNEAAATEQRLLLRKSTETGGWQYWTAMALEEVWLTRFISLDPGFVATPLNGWSESQSETTDVYQLGQVPSVERYVDSAWTRAIWSPTSMVAQCHEGWFGHTLQSAYLRWTSYLTNNAWRPDAAMVNLRFSSATNKPAESTTSS